MADKSFYIWATLISDRAANALVVGLVRKGIAVEPAATTDNLTIHGDVSTLCSIRACADRVPEHLPTGQGPQHWVLERVKEVLDESKDSYYSLIVFEIGGSSAWDGSNIKLPKKPELAPVEPAAPVEPEKPTAIDLMDKALDT